MRGDSSERSGGRIALVDYGAGNLTSVRKALAALEAAFWSPEHAGELDVAAGIIVPGVGNFQATATLDASWHAAVSRGIAAGVPVLGICLGLQWLFEGSEEAPDVPGLGLLAGRCRRLPEAPPHVKIPHVGWNTLQPVGGSWLLDGVDAGTYVYFTHAFAAPVTPACASTTRHGVEFASSVERDRVGAVQFHPEKSGPAGLRILRNFQTLVADAHAVRP